MRPNPYKCCAASRIAIKRQIRTEEDVEHVEQLLLAEIRDRHPVFSGNLQQNGWHKLRGFLGVNLNANRVNPWLSILLEFALVGQKVIMCAVS